MTLPQHFIDQLIQRFGAPNVGAIVLTGSYAKGNADEYSDVDILRLVDEGANVTDDGSHLFGQKLVTVSTAFPNNIEQWFMDPRQATQVIAGLRTAQALYDPNNIFAEIQARAVAFTWNETMQAKANKQVSEQMVGLAEEVQKGLGGLKYNHAGRLLQARYGLSWLLANIVQVQRGILIESDNTVIEQLTKVVGLESSWSYWCYRAFGLENPGLREEVMAGLKLYIETYRLLHNVLRSEDTPRITHAIKWIEQARVPL